MKKAFRRLSLQYHPDKNSDPAAAPVFLQISQAYKALTGALNDQKYTSEPHQCNVVAMQDHHMVVTMHSRQSSGCR